MLIKAKGYKLKSAKGKGAWDKDQEKPDANFPVELHRNVA